jgi:uncharacterized protein
VATPFAKLRASLASQPFHLMIKPAGPACNLACRYCYYLEKAGYYPGSRFSMEDQTLEAVTAAYLQCHPGNEVVFGWQGGEPLLVGVDFYRRAVALQRRYARPGQAVVNALQTNATLVDDDWAAFFREHDFLIGVSIDGPPELHDRYRRDRAGRPTYQRVLSGIRLLQQHEVRCNALVTVNRRNAEQALEVYRHLTGLGFAHLQFIPVVERPAQGPQAESLRHEVTTWSVRPEALGKFLCDVFDYWARNDVGRVFVQLFEAALNVWLGREATLCVFSPTCGRALAVEHNGDLYACDHFVCPEHLLGKVSAETLAVLVDGPRQRAFGNAKADLSEDCRACPVLRFCGGDCPKHRLRAGADKRPISYLCAAYLRFFTHSAPVLEAMAHEVRAGRPAANVMAALR